jgi:hypothetical protein
VQAGALHSPRLRAKTEVSTNIELAMSPTIMIWMRRVRHTRTRDPNTNPGKQSTKQEICELHFE